MASGSSRRASRDSLPLYQTQYHGGLAEDFINVQPMPVNEKDGGDLGQDYANGRSSINYMPPPFPPPGWHDEEGKETFWHRHGGRIKTNLVFLFMTIVSAALLYPIILYRPTEDWTEEETPEQSHKQLVWHVFIWLFIAWTNLLLWFGLAKLMPHAFRFWAAIFNPGQEKYWHILKFMTPAVTMLGGAVGNYVAYVIIIFNNSNLLINAKKEKGDTEIEKLLIKLLTRTTTIPSKRPWPRLLNELMTTLLLWAILFFFEKILITYISIHYNYRSSGKRIESHKRMRHALNTLYDASISLFPPFHEQFKLEDDIIAGKVKHKVHLLKSKTTSRIVDRALEDNRSSAALAKRIWLSLVPQGRDTLTVDDIVEVIKSHRRAEAEDCFRAIDINQNGDLTLNEMVLTVMEMGRQRRSIYQGMMDIDRALNSFDWICVSVMASVIGAYLTLRYVRSMKGLKDAMGISLIGLSFGFGRTIFEFLGGCIFIFLKHAYDVGDRIEVYNVASTTRTSVVVERISILYTIFRRIDNGKELQMSNDRLNMKRIENVTRSGANREEISIFVDFNTTFTDIENLKVSLQKFVRAKENTRDYQPNVEIRLNNIFEMNKLELVCSFYHKSNWANEELRAARSSKFKCALLSVIRGMPLAKPGGLAGNPAQKESFEQAREDAAYNSFTMVPVTSDVTTEERLAGNVATGSDINSYVGYGATGLRRRENNFSGGILYGVS